MNLCLKKQKSKYYQKVLNNHVELIRVNHSVKNRKLGIKFVGSETREKELADTLGLDFESYLSLTKGDASALTESLEFIEDLSTLVTYTPSELVHHLFFCANKEELCTGKDFSLDLKNQFQVRLRHLIEEFRSLECYSRELDLKENQRIYLTDEELAEKINWPILRFKKLIAKDKPSDEYIACINLICTLSKGFNLSPSEFVNRLFTWNRSVILD